MSDDLPDPPLPPPPPAGPGPAAAAVSAEPPGATPECVAPNAKPADENPAPDVVSPVSPSAMAANPKPGENSERVHPGALDDDADPVLLSSTTRSAAGTKAFAPDGAERDTSTLLRDRSTALSDDWQDYLIDAVPLPGEIAADDAGAFENGLSALQQRRVLLICHAPTPSAEARATAALRHAVSELLRREPRCSPLSSKYDRPFAPQNLSHTPQWRGDRRRSVIYLFRSDSSDSVGFFNRQIEPVRHLCRTLRDNDSYLLLTVAVADAVSLCEESLLAREIALWRLRDAPSVPTEAPVVIGDRFDAVLVACAALLPGLGFREFSVLVESLVAPPVQRADAKPETRSRAERWQAGEFDAVRAELHVVLRAPHTLDDVATADANAEPGMYLDTRDRRVHTPYWLYERHASVLDHMADALAERYFTGQSTLRFGSGYRRLLLGLDKAGVRRLDENWIVRQLEAALHKDCLARAVVRVAEFLRDVVAAGDPGQFAGRCVTAVASLLVASEARLIEALQASDVLGQLAAQRRAPYAPFFWSRVDDHLLDYTCLVSVAENQGSVLDLLLVQSFLDPVATATALATHIEKCGAEHAGWLSACGLWRHSQVPFPYARGVLRDTLAGFLVASTTHWLDYAAAVTALCNRADASAEMVDGARRLARDFISAVAMNCEELLSGSSPGALYRSLLGDAPARLRLADTLAGLFAVTSPKPGAGVREPASVDLPAALSIYRSLVQSLLRHHADAAELLPDVIALLSRPWVRTLRREQQVRVAQVVRDQLQKLQRARADCFGDKPALRTADEAVRALQMFVRSWQSPVRPADSGTAASDQPVLRRLPS